MTPEDFHDALNDMPSIEGRIILLDELNYDLYMDPQPDSIVSWFYDDLETQEQADEIASIFVRKLGKVIICREASSCMKKLKTIMDCIVEDQFFEGYAGATLMIKAFRKLGVKRAIQCDTKILIKKFTDDSDYSLDYIAIRAITTNKMKKRKATTVSGLDLNVAFTKMKLSR